MFNEENSVEDYIKDMLVKLGWKFVPKDQIPRQDTDVLVEEYVKNALIKLNPSIKEDPDRADEVLYKLRAIILSVRGTGVVKTNEEFMKWIKNEKSMPFGEHSEHVSITLIDYENPQNNEFIVTTQYSFSAGQNRRPDLVLLVNGIPLIIGECKTPVRPSISWVDGAIQLEEYQNSIPALFVPNVFCFATEGKTYRCGSIKLPIEKWQPWRKTTDGPLNQLEEVGNAVDLMLLPDVVLDICQNFTVFSSIKGGQKIKILSRYQQYEGAKQIVQRVMEGRIKKGLIWHFQGSGKTILMVFAAMMLRKEPILKSPTVIIVVDRIDLNSQMSATFNAAMVPNIEIAESREQLNNFLEQDTRKIIITTIHKFADANDVLNDRENIVCLVDECHRTQEGDLGKNMRSSLPNAFLFGLTGTPINKRDRNTFWAFGAEEDTKGYMNKYGFDRSIGDKATLPIFFKPRIKEIGLDKETIDAFFDALTQHLETKDRAALTKKAAKFGVLCKAPDTIGKVTVDIVNHFKEHVEPNGFKGMIVVYDRQTCHLYKEELDKHMAPEESAVVMTLAQGDPNDWRDKYSLTSDQQEKLLDRFRDPKDPLKIVIVTSKLLTGFDAEILQAMYLDKPMKDHTLLQAICRVNRPYPGKDHGLIVDYLGIFDNVGKALSFDEESIKSVISNVELLKKELPLAIKKCLIHFEGIDRTVGGYEGLLAAQECLPSQDKRDVFGADYSYLARHWESISPDPMLRDYEEDYKWLTQVYQSLRPPSGNGKLVWHALGGKTLKLIHDNIKVETIRDDLDTLVMDSEMLTKISETEAEKQIKKVEIKIVWRLHKHADDPKFKALGERLEALKEKHHQKAISSLEFLKNLLIIARETVQLERDTKAEPVDDTKEALTKLFLECKVETTPVIIEKIVSDIDSVVKVTRFDGWQWTNTGEREIQQALRRSLLRFKLHKEQDLFDKAYNYIREHY